MVDNKIIKCEIELGRIFFPKNSYEVASGEHAIFVANIINKLENCDGLPKLWGQSKIKLKGKVCKLESYVTYKVACRLIERHEKYGDTYEILFINKKIDLTNKSQQIDFLEGIINPNIVYKLFEKYDDVITLLEDKDISALTSIKGIGHATAMRIIEEFEDCKDYSQIYTELSNANLSANLINKLLDFYKSPDTVVDIVKNNPYRLVEVSGVGFKKADEIAQKMGMIGNDSRRVKACIINTLAGNGEIGRSYLHFSELMNIVFDQIGFIEQDIINDVAKQLVDKKEINVSDDGQLIGLKRYYDLEMNIHNELIRLLNAERSEEFELGDWEDTIKSVEEEQGFAYTSEQIEAVKLIIDKNIVALTGSAGCVDCDTEYFNGVGWKKISDYIEGENVLQYNRDGTAELVLPERYIKEKEEYLNHIKNETGSVDQCVCDNHNIVYLSSKNNLNIKKCSDLIEMHYGNQHGFSGRFITTFKYDGKGIDLTDDQIRLMVAVIADGSLMIGNSNFTCRFHVRKDRKKKRLIELFKLNNLKWREADSAAEGFSDFYVNPPRLEKEFTAEYWYNCSYEQLKIIASEVLNWDGSIRNNRESFSANVKSTADFVQFVFSATGKRAKLGFQDRRGQSYLTSGKLYTRKSIDYDVHVSQRAITVGIQAKDKYNINKIEKYKTIDGYKYCFTVPSHMLILRRNGSIFITGNCGKTATLNGIVQVFKDYIISAAALSGKASVRITEATGLKASTIHRLLGYSHGEFTYNEENPLDTDVVLIDETTMINGDIFLSLLKAIPNGAKLIIVGDIKQLTPIGNCQVFSDILNSNVIPSIVLTKIHRQAEMSGIIVTSIKISEQEQILKPKFEGNLILGELQDMELDIHKEDDSPSDRVIKHFLKHYEASQDIMETQVLSPMRTRGDLSTYSLNNKIQSIINPVSDSDIFIEVKVDKDKSYKIKLGDKVINTKNNYKSINVDSKVTPIFNGNMGIVKEIDNGVCVVDFIGIGEIVLDRAGVKKLELAYAVTIHKSMGSGFHTAIVCIESSAYVLLNTELLYTGVTRAKKYCVLVGQNSAIRTAIKTREIKKKQTYLKDMLQTIV